MKKYTFSFLLLFAFLYQSVAQIKTDYRELEVWSSEGWRTIKEEKSFSVFEFSSDNGTQILTHKTENAMPVSYTISNEMRIRVVGENAYEMEATSEGGKTYYVMYGDDFGYISFSDDWSPATRQKIRTRNTFYYKK